MRDYDATVKNLREAAKGLLFDAMPYRASVIKDAADTIEELLDELTTIRKQLPHWISVEERLPEHHKPVLVAYIGFNSNLLLSDMIAYRDGDGDWCWWDGKFPSGDICEVKVTYWMPLPAPPKGVK